MGQYFRVNGDYNIKAKSGGTIVIDAGEAGNISVVGNLTVTGGLTSISSNDVEIKDRIIVLNKDESGPGVSLRYSGIEIDRGPNVDNVTNYTARRAFVFDEAASAWIVVSGSDRNSSYGFNDSNLKLRRIYTDASTDSGDLTLIGTGLGVVKVAGTTNYEAQVTDDDDVPNKKYVDDAIQNNPTIQIRKDDTRILIADRDVSPNTTVTGGSLNYYISQTGYTTYGESAVGILVDGVQNSIFYPGRAVIQGLEFKNTEITNDSTNTNIFIRTNGTGKLQTNYGVQLDHPGVIPASINGSHVLYAGDEGPGDSGFYFASINRRDEFVSKRRALVFSMIF